MECPCQLWEHQVRVQIRLAIIAVVGEVIDNPFEIINGFAPIHIFRAVKDVHIMMLALLLCQQMVRSRAGDGAHDKAHSNLSVSTHGHHCSLSDKVTLGEVLLSAKDAYEGERPGCTIVTGNAEKRCESVRRLIFEF